MSKIFKIQSVFRLEPIHVSLCWHVFHHQRFQENYVHFFLLLSYNHQ